MFHHVHLSHGKMMENVGNINGIATGCKKGWCLDKLWAKPIAIMDYRRTWTWIDRGYYWDRRMDNYGLTITNHFPSLRFMKFCISLTLGWCKITPRHDWWISWLIIGVTTLHVVIQWFTKSFFIHQLIIPFWMFLGISGLTWNFWMFAMKGHVIIDITSIIDPKRPGCLVHRSNLYMSWGASDGGSHPLSGSELMCTPRKR